MIKLARLELATCAECPHYFVRPHRVHFLRCNRCGGNMVAVPVYVDHRDVAGLPLGRPVADQLVAGAA